jgi:hypothetical protein
VLPANFLPAGLYLSLIKENDMKRLAIVLVLFTLAVPMEARERAVRGHRPRLRVVVESRLSSDVDEVELFLERLRDRISSRIELPWRVRRADR